MNALTFWKIVTKDTSDFLGRLVAFLADHGARYAVVGGQAVNAYAEPLVSLDLDLAIAADEVERLEKGLTERFQVARFAHGLNLSQSGSDLRVQIQTDPRYAPFVERAAIRTVLGLDLPVADIRDVLQGKIWAALDPTRRPTKRAKDRLDILRLLEAHPELTELVPTELRSALY
jgi:hypothetical protein